MRSASGWPQSGPGSPRRASRPAAASRNVTLIAITKTRPASDIGLLSELGVTDVGENRAQEAAAKAAECAALGLRITWHFVGQLQVEQGCQRDLLR